jgi:hypothetical protein
METEQQIHATQEGIREAKRVFSSYLEKNNFQKLISFSY